MSQTKNIAECLCLAIKFFVIAAADIQVSILPNTNKLNTRMGRSYFSVSFKINYIQNN